MSQSPSSSHREHKDMCDALIASLDPLKLRELALTARKVLLSDVGSDVSCAIASRPDSGDSSVVYKASFSDGVDWAIKIPIRKDFPSPAAAARRRRLDISTQRFIASKISSMPVPRIHAWSCDDHNPIGRPYIIMNFLPGEQLISLWNDPSWITQDKRERIFEQLAGWMTQLAALEFPRIGRLDVDSGGQIVPFDPDTPDTNLFLGPYDSAHVYISDLLKIKRQKTDEPMLAVLQLYTSLLDHTLDGPPFSLFHPNLASQNILVADDGTITGILDWDNVFVGPRQGGAAAYPEWLILDWLPSYYRDMQAHASAGAIDEPDSPDELHTYREMYLAAIDRASAGKLTHITRNSHVWEAIKTAVTSDTERSSIVNHIHKLIFGKTSFGDALEQELEDAPWYKIGASQNVIVQVPQTQDSSDSDSDSEDNPEPDKVSTMSWTS